MPAPTETHSQSLSTDSTDTKDRSQTASTVGSGVFDDRLIPPSHNVRTLVLCIDGTASNVFDGAVCTQSFSWCQSLNLACRIRTSYGSSICSRTTLTIRASRWSSIRSAKADFCFSETTIENTVFQPGIGTNSESEIKLWSSMDKLVDKAFANRLDTQVMGTLYLVDVSSASTHAYNILYRWI
jgi:hypothetical protein